MGREQKFDQNGPELASAVAKIFDQVACFDGEIVIKRPAVFRITQEKLGNSEISFCEWPKMARFLKYDQSNI